MLPLILASTNSMVMLPDDGRRILGDTAHGPQQHLLVLFRRSGAVFPDPQWYPEDLGELHPGLDAEILE
jgi:hypothetical protein